MNLRLTKKGNVSPNGPPGDLILKINVEDHEMFKRKGFNIHTKKKITVSEAILGSTFDIKTIKGDITVAMPPGIQNGDVKKIINGGISKLPPLHKQRGHHFITFEIEVSNNWETYRHEGDNI